MALATRNLYLVLKARDEASRVIRGFGRELTRTNALVQAEQLRNQAGQASLRAAELRAAGAAQADIDEQTMLARSLRAQAQELERSHASTIRFTNAMQSLSSTLITVGSGLALVGGAGIVGFFQAIKVARDYETQVRLTSTQVTDFKVSLQQLGDIGLKVAQSIAVPFEDIQPALYNIFSSTNATLAEAQTLLTGFAKTAVAGQVSIDDAARGTIPILNAFNIPLSKVNDILDIQFQLVRKGVGTYGEFASVFGRVVPSATRANQSFQEVAAMLAYLTRNGLSAANASTSAARALDALSNPKSVSNMEKLGIKVRDVKGQLLPLETVLSNLSKYLNTLPAKDKVGALVDIFKGAGGTIQARRFLDQVLLRPGELDEFKGFLTDMNNATGAFGSAYATMADSVASKTQLLENQWKVLEQFVGSTVSPIFAKIIGYLADLLNKFNSLDPGTKSMIVRMALLGAGLTAFAGFVLIALGALAGLFAAIVSAGTAFWILLGAISAVIIGIIAFGALVYNAWQKSKQFRDIIHDIGTTIKDVYEHYIKPTAIDIYNAFMKYVWPPLVRIYNLVWGQIIPSVKEFADTLKKNLGPAAKHFGDEFKTAVIDMFKALGWTIDHVLKPPLEWMDGFYKRHKKTIDEVAAVTGQFVGWILLLAAILGVGSFIFLLGVAVATFAALAIIIYAVATAVIWVIDKIKEFIRWIGSIIDAIGGIISSLGLFSAAFFNLGAMFVDALNSGAKDQLPEVGKTFDQAKQDILNVLNPSPFYSIGKAMMVALASGMNSAGKDVAAAAVKAAQTIQDHFPHSPAKMGPLSGKGDTFYSGQKIMQRLSTGMNSVNLANALQGPTGAISAASGPQPLVSPYKHTNTTINQYITLNTQKVSPTQQASELGFLLAGRP